MTVAPTPAGKPRSVAPLWRDVRVLRVAAQIVVVALVLLIGWLLWSTLSDNMAASRLSFGLGFLEQTAGFEIAQTPISFGSTDTFARAFAVGLLNTLLVSISGIVLATLLGVVVGVARLSRNWLANRIAAGYVELMRNTPLLVQLILLYVVFLQLPSVANSVQLPGSIFLNQRGLFMPRPEAEPTFGIWAAVLVVSVLIAVAAARLAARREADGRPTYRLRTLGILALVALPLVSWLVLGPVAFDQPIQERFNFVGGVSLSPEFAALLLGLVIYTAAFIGEVVRGAIQAVRRGQVEAAYAIGLTPGQTLRLVVFPQALRIIVPPLTSQYLNLTKNSSLAVAIGFADVFSVGRTMVNQTGQPLSVIALVMGTYLVLSLVTSLFMNVYNRRVQVLER
ncbi:MAG TPA: ABC transporter permease subunit [Candidatus Limnocylindria bacterium]|nr:ABC transporter permease subunit [Candidatus Limnocylindria bacterium]